MSQTPEYPVSSTEPPAPVVVGYPEQVVDTTSYGVTPTYEQPEPSKADVAKEQAAAVGGTAADAGKQVAGVAKDQASNVASEAVQQSKNLLSQATTELQDQASTQQQRLASGIRALSDELGSMAKGSEESGMATDLVHQAAQRANDVAGWLENRDPGTLLADVRDFARRKPGVFLAVAAGAGLLAGRLTRGTVDANRDNDPSGSSTGSPTSPTRAQSTVTPTGTAYSAPDRTAPAPAYTDPGYTPPGYSAPGYTAPVTPGYPDPAIAFLDDPAVVEQNQAGGRP